MGMKEKKGGEGKSKEEDVIMLEENGRCWTVKVKWGNKNKKYEKVKERIKW